MHRTAVAVMAEALDADPEAVYQITRDGNIGKHSNPLIRQESRPDHHVVFDDEKGTKTMNTRILFINGKRMPQGVIADFKSSGGLAERSLMIFFLAAFIADSKINIKDIAVDEYYQGRLQTRYEWNSSDDKRFGPMMLTKVKKNKDELAAVCFRMVPINDDTFTR